MKNGECRSEAKIPKSAQLYFGGECRSAAETLTD